MRSLTEDRNHPSIFARTASLIGRLLGAALLVGLTGCAAAYHDYSDCCVPYLYCWPAPLPYVAYRGCHCPTPGACGYDHLHGAVGQAADTPASDSPDADPQGR